jgi:hypothetical protein
MRTASFKVGGVLLMMVGVAAWGTPVIDQPITWTNPPGGTEGWATQSVVGASPSVTNPGAPGYLQITFPSQGAPLPGSAEIVSSQPGVTGSYGGSFGEFYTVSFDFMCATSTPSEWGVYFYSSTSGNTWMYTDLNYTETPGDWQTFELSLEGTGWHLADDSYDAAQFDADLTDVDWIGIYISRDGEEDAEIYGLDNWVLHFQIPEPGTIPLLSAVLLSLCMTFRGYLGGAASKVKAMIGLA